MYIGKAVIRVNVIHRIRSNTSKKIKFFLLLIYAVGEFYLKFIKFNLPLWIIWSRINDTQSAL